MSDGTLVEPVELGITVRRTPRRWWPFALLAAVPLVIVALVYVVACWRAHTILRQAMEEIAERGEPVRFAELAPPADDKALARGRALDPLINKLNRVPWELLDQAATQPLTDALATSAQHAVDAHRSDVQAILNVLRQGECRFDYDYQTRTPYDIVLPHVQNLGNVWRLLAAECHLALAKGDRLRATGCMRELLELDRALYRDPFSVSQRLRRRIAVASLDALQAVASHGAASNDDLQWIDDRLRTMESSFRLADCMRAERAAAFTTMENLGRPEMTRSLTDDARGVSHTKAAVRNYWWGSWLYRPRRLFEESVMLRAAGRRADLIDEPGPTATAQFDAASAPAHSNDFPVFHELVSHLDKLREMGLNHRQRLISARLGLAVCRHRQRHGRLPESLDDLESSPIENFTGLLSAKPLVYQKTPGGFAIYDDVPEQGRFEVKFVGAVQ